MRRRWRQRRSEARADLVDVFPGVVRAAHQGAGFDVAKAQRHRLGPQLGEFGRGDVALDRQMVARGAQVLPQRQDVALDRAQVAQHLEQFVVALAQTRA